MDRRHPALAQPGGAPIIRQAGKLIDPGAWQALESLLDDPRLQPRGKGIRLDTLGHLARGLGPVLARMALNMLRPAPRYRQLRRRAEQQLARLEAEGAALTTPAAQADFLSVVLDQAPLLLRNWVMPGIGAGLGSWAALQRVARHIPGGPDLARDAIRGLPHNVTTEMDLALWQTAQRIGPLPSWPRGSRASPPPTLAAAYQAGQLPVPAQEAVAAFLRRYGMRGVAEIDLGRRRWRDDPTRSCRSCKATCRSAIRPRPPTCASPQGAAEAQAAIRRLIAAARASPRARAAVVRRLGPGHADLRRYAREPQVDRHPPLRHGARRGAAGGRGICGPGAPGSGRRRGLLALPRATGRGRRRSARLARAGG